MRNSKWSGIIMAFIFVACWFGVCNLYGQGQNPSASTVEQYLKLAEEKRQAGDVRGATDYLNKAASKCWDEKDYPKAIQYYNQSIELNKIISNGNAIAGINCNLGTIYSDMNEYEKSYEHFKLAYTYRKEKNEHLSVISSLINMSLSLNKMERFNESIKILEEALEIAKSINDYKQIHSCYGNLAETYGRAGNTKRAREYFNMYQIVHESLISDSQKQLNEADLKALLAEKEEELAEKERELAEREKLFAEREKLFAEREGDLDDIIRRNVSSGVSSGLAEMSKKFLEVDTERRLALDSLSRAGLVYEILKNDYEISKLQIQQEKTKSRILFGGLFLTVFVVFIIGFFLQQKKKDNRSLALQRDQIASQRKEIMDSIYYAQHIQLAIMPDPSLRHEILSDHFLFLRPRDIVSGDFYWATRHGNKSVVVAADCTGHGVPGAFLSMLGISYLNEIVLKLGIYTASEILDQLRDNIKTTMTRTSERRDGMDLALCVIDYDSMELQYAGAYSPLYIVRKGELMIYSPDKMPVGIHTFVGEETKFTNHVIPLQNEDMLYIFTDGYIDQFGGKNDTKFKSKPFKQLLTRLSTMPTEQQKNILIETHDQWKGTGFQVDDILVIGIRITEPTNENG